MNAKATAKKPQDKLFVISAFLLDEGSCVFFQQQESWVNDIANAQVITADDLDIELGVAHICAQKNYVVDIYAMEVEKNAQGKIEPVAIREKMRVNGPSINLPI